MPERLRVIDFGRVSPLRSQTSWHALAFGVSAGADATLSFARPDQPYVCIGYHRRIEEVDLDVCRERGLPVYRRMVGGGPVYLDDGQLFFQLTLPMALVPPVRAVALRRMLEPAVEAFHACGVAAALDEDGEIVVDSRKVCGHGGGQIEDAAVVVGNLIERFDHEAAASIVRAPSAAARAQALSLMRANVAATPVDAEVFKAAAVTAYGEAFGLDPVFDGTLTDEELRALAELDRQFEDPDWVRGQARPAPAAWQLKLRAGVWLLAAEHDGTEVLTALRGRRVDEVRITDRSLNGSARRLESALAGRELDDVAEVAEEFGDAGRRVAAALAKGDGGRL